MSEFVFLYRRPAMSWTVQQMQESMEKWQAWFKTMEQSGHLANYGHPKGRKVARRAALGGPRERDGGERVPEPFHVKDPHADRSAVRAPLRTLQPRRRSSRSVQPAVALGCGALAIFQMHRHHLE
jgi:hypothetical protein